MGSIEAISWFLIERNTIKRFTPIRLPVVVAVQGKDFWRRGRLRRAGYGTANFRRLADYMGLSQRSGRAGVIDVVADTGYGAILGCRAGEQQWSMVLTSFAQAGNYDPRPVREDALRPPPSTSRGRCAPRSMTRHRGHRLAPAAASPRPSGRRGPTYLRRLK